jgi:hypothetical protein
MADNPYVGTENESDWQAGYDAGIASPGGVPEAPDGVLVDDAARAIWAEGALAGHQDGQQHGFIVPMNVEPQEPQHGGPGTAIHWMGYGMDATDLVLEGIAVKKHVATLGAPGALGPGLALALGAFILLVTLEEPPDPPLSAQAREALANAAAASGRDELFVALCGQTSHSSNGDSILAQGYWHGDLATSFTPAWQQAETHLVEEPDALGWLVVAHFSAGSPDMIELITQE